MLVLTLTGGIQDSVVGRPQLLPLDRLESTSAYLLAEGRDHVIIIDCL